MLLFVACSYKILILIPFSILEYEQLFLLLIIFDN